MSVMVMNFQPYIYNSYTSTCMLALLLDQCVYVFVVHYQTSESRISRQTELLPGIKHRLFEGEELILPDVIIMCE